jgi:hypothetical protein
MEGKNYYSNNWSASSFWNGLPLIGLVTNNTDIYPSYIDTQSATNAYKVVLSDVGCNLPAEDLIDIRVIGEVLDGTTHYIGTNGPNYTIGGVLQDDRGPDNAGLIDLQTDVHDYTNDITKTNYSANYPWPPYYTYNVPVDTDHDGLPDWWERIKGLNTNSPAGDFSDANADLANDGYTELDRYLNWLARPHYDCTNGTTLNVDLDQYTRGFTNFGPTYVVFGATNGTVSLSGRTAQFNSTVATNGLGSFMFKVTDNTGFSYTNTVNVRLIVNTPSANTAPVLASITNRMINAGFFLNITNTATDADAGQTLTYSLPVAPTNASVNSASGVLNWRPLVTQANSSNPFTVVVTDNGTPNLSATQSFNVTVNPLILPSIVSPQVSNGRIVLTVSGQAGPDYSVQVSSNLLNWNTLLITNPAVMPFSWSTNAGTLPTGFYRIQVGPPLP